MGLGAVIALILANAFFVAGEFAIVAVERSSVEGRARDGDRRAQRILASLTNLSFELSGAQLGITITSLILGAIAEPAVAGILTPWLSGLGFVSEDLALPISVALAFILATGTQMVFGELVPKNLAISRPYWSAVVFGIPMQFVNRLVRPLILFLNNSADWTVRKLGIEPRAELAGVRSIEELDLMIRASGEEGRLQRDEMTLLTSAITFTEKIAAQAMVPRVQIVALQRDRAVSDLRDLSRETGHSRFPIYGEDLDDIVGVVHVKDSLGIPADQRESRTVAGLARQPLRLPAAASLENVLRGLQEAGRGLAIVVDEYGGTAGIITIEDVLEEFLGDIEDEYDQALARVSTLDPREDLSGLMNRHEVEEVTGFRWPDGPYETLGGFLVALVGRFPAVGEVIAVDGLAFEVLEMDGHRIDRVRVEALETGAAE